MTACTRDEETGEEEGALLGEAVTDVAIGDGAGDGDIEVEDEEGEMRSDEEKEDSTHRSTFEKGFGKEGVVDDEAPAALAGATAAFPLDGPALETATAGFVG